MGASSPTPSNSLTALLAVYSYLATQVDPALSSTAHYLRSGNPDRARDRLIDEVDEALSALSREHTHPPQKTVVAVGLLEDRGCSAKDADLLLELSQISYWALLFAIRSGADLTPGALQESLEQGADDTKTGPDLAIALRASPTAVAAYRLIGRLAGEHGLPIDLFAELDLLEMAQRPYLAEFIRGL